MSPYKSASDIQLLALIQKKNERAFKAVYQRYWAVLYRHALRMTGSEEEAKDIIQELFADLWQNAPNMRIRDRLSGYLYKAIRNRVLNSIEKQRVRADYQNYYRRVALPSECFTDETLHYKELEQLIEEEVAKLPEKMQAVFLLSRQEQQSYKEIAETLQVSENTVRKQVSNALKILRVKLGTFFFLLLTFFF